MPLKKNNISSENIRHKKIRIGDCSPLSALFALIEGSSALAFAASAAMFLSGVGVDGLPLAYILLFAVMLCAMGGIAARAGAFPTRTSIRRLFDIFACRHILSFVGIFFRRLRGIFAENSPLRVELMEPGLGLCGVLSILEFR